MIVRIEDLIEAIGHRLYDYVKVRDGWTEARIECEIDDGLQRYAVTLSDARGERVWLNVDDDDQELAEELGDLHDELWQRFAEQGAETWRRSILTLQPGGEVSLTFRYAYSPPDPDSILMELVE